MARRQKVDSVIDVVVGSPITKLLLPPPTAYFKRLSGVILVFPPFQTVKPEAADDTVKV
jgi:hypothetical protein